MMLSVVACPRCRRAKVVENGKRSTECAKCGDRLDLTQMRAFWVGPSAEEARHAAGAVNAKLARREDEFADAMLPSGPAKQAHDDRFAAAAAAARRASSEKDRADRVARALGEFTREDLAEAFRVAGLPAAKTDAHLARMLATDVVFEPKSGSYRAF